VFHELGATLGLDGVELLDLLRIQGFRGVVPKICLDFAEPAKFLDLAQRSVCLQCRRLPISLFDDRCQFLLLLIRQMKLFGKLRHLNSRYMLRNKRRSKDDKQECDQSGSNECVGFIHVGAPFSGEIFLE
jgi:hypothetical protein